MDTFGYRTANAYTTARWRKKETLVMLIVDDPLVPRRASVQIKYYYAGWSFPISDLINQATGGRTIDDNAEQMDGWTDGQTNEHTDGRKDHGRQRQTVLLIILLIHVYTYSFLYLCIH